MRIEIGRDHSVQLRCPFSLRSTTLAFERGRGWENSVRLERGLSKKIVVRRPTDFSKQRELLSQKLGAVGGLPGLLQDDLI